MDFITAEYDQGVSDYYAGIVPPHWDNQEYRERSPYLTGWLQASQVDNYGEDFLITEEAISNGTISEDY